MKKNLESRLFSKKRAKQLYLYALSRGDKTKAEKLKEFYDLDCEFEKSLGKLYQTSLALGDYQKAQKIVSNYGFQRNIESDKHSPETQRLSHIIYNRLLDKQYFAHTQMQQEDEDTQANHLINLKRKVEAYKATKSLVSKTQIPRKPDADFVYISSNPPFREFEIMKTLYTNKGLENTSSRQNKKIPNQKSEIIEST